MIAGHLQIKNDNYYMVLNYTDANGKRRQPWIPTGLPAKGNKRRAEKLLLDTRKSFVPPVVSKENEDISSNMLFADYMELWLEIIRSSVEKTTFSSYTQMVKGKIVPYFRNTGLTLDGIQAKHIQSFYLHELKTVSPGTVIHYHANIHKALKYAVKMDLIPFNPADKVERPKKQRYIADYYRQEELERLLEASKDHPYSLLIQMTAFYGLRRSEALGLKWDAIDFERDTITIKHIVTNAKIDGKCEIVCADRAKTKSSLRSLPLVSNIREKLLALREQQKENRRVCGNCYSKKYDGYVFVDAIGDGILQLSVRAVHAVRPSDDTAPLRISLFGCNGDGIARRIVRRDGQRIPADRKADARSVCGERIIREHTACVSQRGGVDFAVPFKLNILSFSHRLCKKARHLGMALNACRNGIVIAHDLTVQRVVRADLLHDGAFAARADLVEIGITLTNDRFPNQKLGCNGMSQLVAALVL